MGLLFYLIIVPLGIYFIHKKNLFKVRPYFICLACIIGAFIIFGMILVGTENSSFSNPLRIFSPINSDSAEYCAIEKSDSSATIIITGTDAKLSCNYLLNRYPNDGFYLLNYKPSSQNTICSVKVSELLFTIQDSNSDGFQGGYLCRWLNNYVNGISASSTPFLVSNPTSIRINPKTTAALLHVVVNVDNLNIRSGPGQNYSIVQTVKRGDIFVYQGQSSDLQWIIISKGWVYAPYVSIY